MSQKTFLASAGIWGYQLGLGIPREVRDTLFRKSWKNVRLTVGRETVTINLPPSFWKTCHELRNAMIARWLESRGLDKWPRGNPPKIRIQHLGDNRFKVIGRA